MKISTANYDDVVTNVIKSKFIEETTSSAFCGDTTSNEAFQNHINDTVSEAVIELLKNELESKNKQIKELQEHNAQQSKTIAKLADQAQQGFFVV